MNLPLKPEHDPFVPPPNAVAHQKDHDLGVNLVAKYMQQDGYLIQSVCTDLNKHPQIVAERSGFLVFVEVQTQRSEDMPELTADMRNKLLEAARQADATCFFAPVALWTTG